MGILDKDAFLQAVNRPAIDTKDVDFPELGGSVRVREMTGSIRNRLEAAYAGIKNGGDAKVLDNVTAQLLAVCVIDVDGRQIMSVGDAKRLISGRPKVAFKLRDEVLDVSATDDADVEALAEVFGDARSDSSISD